MDATTTKNLEASTPGGRARDQLSSKAIPDEGGNETSLQFEDGLIPSEHQQSSIGEPALDEAIANVQAFAENSLSHNLLSILQRPTFLESPAARWTAPPQWLQFQMLRNFDEGLMVNENQQSQDQAQLYPSYGGPTTSIFVEEAQSQVQINLQGLLQSRRGDVAPIAATRWQIPESWAQSSMGDSFPIRPPISLGHGNDSDGLILADRGAPFLGSTPAVTCNFGLMQKVGYGERKLEFFAQNFSAIDAGFFANRLQAQAANTVDLMFL
jgi:hypothetical protein